MTYENEIIQILSEADPEKGLPLSSIVRHIHNLTNSDLFRSRPYEEIHADVRKYLQTECLLSGSPIERTGKRGYYRINKRSQRAQQLLLEFSSSEENA